MGLTVDFGMGFVCFDAASKVGARRSSVLGRKRNKRPRLSEKTGTCATQSPTQNPLPLMLHRDGSLQTFQMTGGAANSARYWNKQ